MFASDSQSLLDFITAWISARTQRSIAAVDSHQRFHDAGLSSLALTELVAELSARTGSPISPAAAFEHATPAALALHAAGRTSTRLGAIGAISAIGAPAESESDSDSDSGTGAQTAREPIAIVGIGCRFPGASDPRAFWSLLASGRCAIGEAPARWKERLAARRGAFLDRVDGFDPAFFHISPREAEQIDPQQRLALELAWEALEDAAIAPDTLRGTKTGVFMGVVWQDYALLRRGELSAITPHTGTGQSPGMVANRVSYFLGLEGPSLVLDTACSSSLVAVHLALRSLWSGECTRALAGGVNLMLAPETTALLSEFGGLSPDGELRAFDARANGFVRGEGGGVLVLEPLATALAEGHEIYCVIRGAAVNNDGASNGLTAPNPRAQEAVLRAAYADAGVDPRSVHYVEAHGTGTALGDPIEARSLGAVLGAGRARPLRIGSVKTNIGHLEGAAGIAGVCKTALALARRELPRSLGFETPSPHIPFVELGLEVQVSHERWPAADDEPARAGVSAFGWGGTNCHLVLEQAPYRRTRIEAVPAAPARRSRVAFVFSPQGGQWPAMARELLATEPAFQSALAACDRALVRHGHWSVMRLLAGGSIAPDEVRGPIAQPLLFAMQCALADTWRAYGVEPEAVVGHSMGEIAAAYAAGILTLDDAALVMHHYSRAQIAVAGEENGMGVVELAPERVAVELEGAVEVWIAGQNGPRSTLISGDSRELDRLLAGWRSREISCARIAVDVAAHTPRFDPILAGLAAALAPVRPMRAKIRFVSTSSEVEAGVPEYWTANMRRPVRFAQAIEALRADGIDTFVEVHPHPVLGQAIGGAARVLATSRRERARDTFHETRAALVAERENNTEARAELIVLSGHTPDALAERARSLAAELDGDGGVALLDLAHTMNARRAHLPHRAAFVTDSIAELRQSLAAFAGEPNNPLAISGRARELPVAFVFPGQGSQWIGMGRRLAREEPVFRRSLESTERALRRYVDWSLAEELARPEPASRLGEIDVLQPALFAVEVALAELWRSWGVVPSAVIGHSMGEVAAAHVAGILDLDDAARIIALRSKLLRRVSGLGAMALVELSLESARELVEPHARAISIAVSNGPRATVLAGDRAVLAEIMERLGDEGVFCRWVKVDVASHSPQMDPLLDELRAALAGIRPRAGELTMISTVTGRPIEGGELRTEYWVQNLRQPVLFKAALDRALERGPIAFVEQSPHPILLASIEDALREHGSEAGLAVCSTRRAEDERRILLSSLGALHSAGIGVDWSASSGPGAPIRGLPVYPWQRERHWLRPPRAQAAQDHAILGTYLRIAQQPGLHAWQLQLGAHRFPFLADHGVDELRIVPGATYSVLALAAAEATFGPGAHRLESIDFKHPLFFTESEARTLQITLAAGGEETTVEIWSRQNDAPACEASWTLHVSAKLARAGEPGVARPPALDVAAIRARATAELPGSEHYRRAERAGIYFGPSLAGMERLWRGPGEALARLVASSEVLADRDPHRVHPVLVDLTYQVLLLAAGLEDQRHFGAFVPRSLGAVEIFGEAEHGAPLWAYCRMIRDADDPDSFAGDLLLANEAGEVLLAARALRFQRLRRGEREEEKLPMFSVRWRPAPATSARPPRARWLVFDDAGSAPARLAGECLRAGSSGSAGELRELLQRSGSIDGIAYFAPHFGLQRSGAIDPARDSGVLALLHLVQALAESGRSCRLAVITRGVHAVEPEDRAAAVFHAPLWGFARTLAYELPDLRPVCIDLAAQPEPGEDELLARELAAGGGEEMIALRKGRRYVARLTRDALETRAPVKISPNATYLITGGLGAIGLAFAGALVDRGARHLALVSRNAASKPELEALRARGATVRAFSLDVADRDALAHALAEVRRTMPPLAGVFHAAGVLHDSVIVRLDADRLSAVMRPKVLGAWNLHLATREDRLDFFVLCSSAAALVGTPGQANYAAANAFLDALAHARRADGLRATSVDWGTWAEAGLAAREGHVVELTKRGLDGFSTASALAALFELLGAPIAQAALMKLDLKRWSAAHAHAATDPFFSELEDTRGPARSGAAACFADTLLGVAAGPSRKTALEKHLKEQVGQVLRVAPNTINGRVPLVNLGLDSMMTLELRNRLEASLRIKLPATVVWAHPSVEALASHLLTKLEPAAPRPAYEDQEDDELMRLLEAAAQGE